ncbi:hypothetical protein [Vibrio tritonius]|uniref:hypothetical protein n=1 Tax=Vibrio tritonius TaxID=1435069 RepID=UPI00315D4E8A
MFFTQISEYSDELSIMDWVGLSLFVSVIYWTVVSLIAPNKFGHSISGLKMLFGLVFVVVPFSIWGGLKALVIMVWTSVSDEK